MRPFVVAFSLSYMLTLAIASCANYSVEEGKADLEKDSLQSLLIEKGTTPITADEAVNVALLFNNQNKIETKGEVEKIVSDVYTVFSENREPSMYAVNFEENGGFIVVSASRKYYPILAMVEIGHFDEGYAEMGLSDWVDEQTNLISMIEKEK